MEVRRSLARLLGERDAGKARSAFMRDVEMVALIELDQDTCEMAAGVGGPAVPFLTFDVRQAQAARALGLTVVGA